MIQNTRIKYYVSMPEPHTHYYQVKMEVLDPPTSPTDFHLAVWTPGSYLIREYSRNIINFRAYNAATDEELSSFKIAKNIWRVENNNKNSIYLKYKVYANELTVRTSHLDSSHAYFNGTALFFFIPDMNNEPVSLEIDPPQNWHISTGLVRDNANKNLFFANDWDELVDCPTEIGTHRSYKFKFQGKEHEVALYGEGNYNLEKLLDEIQKIVATVCEIWKVVPYDFYTFIIHLSDNLYGGLEHRNSNTSIFDRFSFKGKKYSRFLSLLTHEFFHVFIVKRIKPESFFPYNYEQETYTRHLWVMEGVTSYYDKYLLLRGKIIAPDILFAMMGENIKRLEQTPGRFVQSIEESSFDAWIKLYRSDENTSNTSVSYYLKGGLVVFALDICIRSKSNNQSSFDDVLRHLYTKFALKSQGYPENPEDFINIIKLATKIDVRTFFDKYVIGREDPDFDEVFGYLGIQLVREYDRNYEVDGKDIGYLGVETESKENQMFIKVVYDNSPAYSYGLNAGDEILAINDYRVNYKNFNERMALFKPGSKINFLLSKKGQILNNDVVLGNATPSKYTLSFVKNPTDDQKDFYNKWSHQDYPKENESR
jgi:predicted metalloprotease with PDZ domain